MAIRKSSKDGRVVVLLEGNDVRRLVIDGRQVELSDENYHKAAVIAVDNYGYYSNYSDREILLKNIK